MLAVEVFHSAAIYIFIIKSPDSFSDQNAEKALWEQKTPVVNQFSIWNKLTFVRVYPKKIHSEEVTVIQKCYCVNSLDPFNQNRIQFLNLIKTIKQTFEIILFPNFMVHNLWTCK